MSLETTIASTVAGECERRWKEHRLNCPRCKPAKPECAYGESVYAEHPEAQAELRRQRELDRQVPPGQGVLWEEEEVMQ